MNYKNVIKECIGKERVFLDQRKCLIVLLGSFADFDSFEYSQQLKFKETGVLQNLQKIGKVNPKKILPILAAPEVYWYRNKLEFSFSTNRWLTSAEIESKEKKIRLGLGFHKPGRWDKIVSIDTCHLQIEPFNKIRNSLRDFAIDQHI